MDGSHMIDVETYGQSWEYSDGSCEEDPSQRPMPKNFKGHMSSLGAHCQGTIALRTPMQNAN